MAMVALAVLCSVACCCCFVAQKQAKMHELVLSLAVAGSHVAGDTDFH